MKILKVYFLLAVGLSLTLTGIGSGGCRAGIEVPEGSLTGSEGEVAAIAIEPAELTTIDDSGSDVFAVCEGVPCEDVTWTFVDQTTATLELELDDPLLSSRPPPRNHKLKQKKIGERSNFAATIVPDPGASNGESVIIKVCRNDKPDVCAMGEFGVVRGTIAAFGNILEDSPVTLEGSTVAPPDILSYKWDSFGCFQTNKWSMCLRIAFVEPEKEAPCEGPLDVKPGTLVINLCGSEFSPSCADYKINTLRDEYACKVLFLQADKEGDGCPANEEPTWVLRDGSRVAFTTAMKDLGEIKDELLTAAAGLVNQFCFRGDVTKQGLEDNAGDSFGDGINKRNFGELIQCAEGAFLVASQIVPAAQSILDSNIFRFSESEPIGSQKIFQCVTDGRPFDKGEDLANTSCNANFVSKGTCDRYDPTKCGCWSLTSSGQSICESYHTDYNDGKTTDYHNCFWGTVNGATGCFAEGSQVGENACRK